MVRRRILAVGIVSVSLIAAAGFALTSAGEKSVGREMTVLVLPESQAIHVSASSEITIPSPKQTEYSPVVSPDDAVPTPSPKYEEHEVEMLAKTVWGEARGCSREEQELVVWTVFQRVDGEIYGGSTIEDVITAPNQFAGYHKDYPVDAEIYEMCLAEAKKWQNGEEPPTFAPYATTAPYYYFDGDGQSNWFREGYAK